MNDVLCGIRTPGPAAPADPVRHALGHVVNDHDIHVACFLNIVLRFAGDGQLKLDRAVAVRRCVLAVCRLIPSRCFRRLLQHSGGQGKSRNYQQGQDKAENFSPVFLHCINLSPRKSADIHTKTR